MVLKGTAAGLTVTVIALGTAGLLMAIPENRAERVLLCPKMLPEVIKPVPLKVEVKIPALFVFPIFGARKVAVRK